MVSFWWIVAAFIGGGFAGMLVIALISMAGEAPEQSTEVPDLKATLW